MKFPCTVHRNMEGRWVARHAGSDLGTVEVAADSQDQALTKLRDELQYRMELCPCSGVSGDQAEVVVHN